MRNPLTLMIVITGMGAASLASAANGTLQVSWGNCTPPVVVDATPVPGGQMSLYFSVQGNDQTHNAYQVQFVIGGAGFVVPDAWHFDGPGCQGLGSITIDHLAPPAVAKTCPSFQGPNASIQIKDVSAAVSPWKSSLLRFTLANMYPATFTSLPGTRYFLARFLFDHLWSVAGPTTPGTNCGGLETPMCFAVSKAEYLMAATGTAAAFDRHYTSWMATTNSPTNALGCDYVSARPATWGQIKSTYRR